MISPKIPRREPLLSRRPGETPSHHHQRILAMLRAVEKNLARNKKKTSSR
jgi:hypothetical protein